ncbi:MAG: helix-turn-helix domain-containing protein [bacterium]|nr:helix-turn-helix domain-containing protein [bacterium]
MDQIKIGKFIQNKRKEKNLTQQDLAEKLLITDRAVSKWECGKSLPDASIMLELCEILEISVNELLTGEEIDMNEYNKNAELNLLKMTKQKEEADKRLLKLEVLIGVMSVAFLIILVLIAALLDMKTWVRITLIGIGFVSFIALAFICIRIEQKAGYYECKECHKTFTPTYWQVNLAQHMGRKRKMRCPHCGKKSWCIKVFSDKSNNE